MDDTRIETAPTPAHIFAYRAFRSVFVGSPESSPIRPSNDAYNVNHNKENARLSPVRGSRFATSPVKSKRDAEIVSDNLNLTPKRQRTNLVSPTKSILKTSSALTPRRAGLRDVTVTFKDVRLSVSPELARKGSPTRVRSQPDMRKTLEALSSTVKSRNASAGQIEKLEKLENHGAVSQSMVDVDIDAYIAQTEKEMRRLIKYGQKWREYARRQEEDNKKLRALVEELQKENGELRSKAHTSVPGVKAQNPTRVAATSSSNVAEAKLPKQRHRSHGPEEQAQRFEQDKWKVPLDNMGFNKRRSRQTATHSELQDIHDLGTGVKRVGNQQREETHSAKKVTKNFERAVPQQKSVTSSTRQHQLQARELPTFDELLSQKQDEPEKTEDNQIEPKVRVESSSEEGRKAAARERLRLRREAKAGNARMPSVSGTTKISKGGHDSSRMENEESQVDWMAMI